MTEIKVYIARDGEKDGQNHGRLCAFLKKPVYENWLNEFRLYPTEPGNCVLLLPTLFPEIPNGTCFEAVVSLREKV